MQGGWPSFYCRFDVLEASVLHRDNHGRFVPPEWRRDQHCTRGALFRWTGQRWEQPVNVDHQSLQPYHFATGSVWIQRESRNFFAFAGDVTQVDVATNDQCLTWELLGFNRGPNGSSIDYAGDQFELHFEGNANWMPHLLPEQYHPAASPSLARGGLIGKLPLLLALFAYSGVLENPARFLPIWNGRYWTPQQSQQSWNSEKGVVVHIWLDPSDQRSNRQNLMLFERGGFGPILPA